jgi:hypothetical protein
MEITSPAYIEVISEWVKEARELLNLDAPISEVLRYALEFEPSKRPFFRDIRSIF